MKIWSIYTDMTRVKWRAVSVVFKGLLWVSDSNNIVLHRLRGFG